MKRNITNRRDVVTRKSYDRDLLIRIAIQKNGTTEIDREYNLKGRGIYILPSSIQIGLEKNILLRNIKRFNGNIEQIIDEIKGEAK